MKEKQKIKIILFDKYVKYITLHTPILGAIKMV